MYLGVRKGEHAVDSFLDGKIVRDGRDEVRRCLTVRDLSSRFSGLTTQSNTWTVMKCDFSGRSRRSQVSDV